MTTTTDVNSMIFHSSPRINNDEISNSFMDIDDIQVSTMTNGHISPVHQIPNGVNEDKHDVFHQG